MAETALLYRIQDHQQTRDDYIKGLGLYDLQRQAVNQATIGGASSSGFEITGQGVGGV